MTEARMRARAVFQGADLRRLHKALGRALDEVSVKLCGPLERDQEIDLEIEHEDYRRLRERIEEKQRGL